MNIYIYAAIIYYAGNITARRDFIYEKTIFVQTVSVLQCK